MECSDFCFFDWYFPDMPQFPYILDTTDKFPPVSRALRKPNGLLALGGDLSPARLLDAYSQGIFPWFSDNEPVMWWSPDPRSVIFVDTFKPARSLQKLIRKNSFQISFDQAFSEVIYQCARTPRKDQNGTWITEQMINAYIHLHEIGVAHSVECYLRGKLVGGLYGIAMGTIFFGESMFSQVSNSSKVAFAVLMQNLLACGFTLVDCQVESMHMNSLGAVNIARHEFIDYILSETQQQPLCTPW